MLAPVGPLSNVKKRADIEYLLDFAQMQFRTPHSMGIMVLCKIKLQKTGFLLLDRISDQRTSTAFVHRATEIHENYPGEILEELFENSVIHISLGKVKKEKETH